MLPGILDPGAAFPAVRGNLAAALGTPCRIAVAETPADAHSHSGSPQTRTRGTAAASRRGNTRFSGTPQAAQYDAVTLATGAAHFQHSCTMVSPQSAHRSGSASGRGAVAEPVQSGLEQIARWNAIAGPSRDMVPTALDTREFRAVFAATVETPAAGRHQGGRGSRRVRCGRIIGTIPGAGRAAKTACIGRRIRLCYSRSCARP
jgi:hypothetical protein